MDRNIYYDAEADTSGATDSTNKGLVAWITEVAYGCGNDDDDYCLSNDKGPVTAMDYLYNATKDWPNIPDMIMNYTDEGSQYGTIVTTNGVTKITKKDGTAVTVLTNKEGYTNLKARMPYGSEVSYCEVENKAYLYDNLHLKCYVDEDDLSEVSCDEAGYIDGLNVEEITHIDGIGGYWLISGVYDEAWYASMGNCDGSTQVHNIWQNRVGGVRPVITLKLKKVFTHINTFFTI